MIRSDMEKKDSFMVKAWLLVFVSLLMLTMMVSCQTAPRVIADVEHHYPARTADSVMIYEEDEEVPSEARAIGKIKVTDGGLTPTNDCLYGNMLALAVKKTAESGGNVLRIDQHKKPTRIGSTCHRIWGTMMLMPDSLIKTDVLTSLQRIELKQDAEYIKMAKDRNSSSKRLLDIPHDVLRISAGPAWITSEFETPVRTYKSKLGFAASAEYQHFWKYGFGLGINYIYYGTSFDEGFKVNMHYLGPTFSFDSNLGRKWIYDAAFGIGYTYYKESFSTAIYNVSETQNRLGVMFRLGIDYKVSEKIGIGFHISGLTMRMKKPEDYDDDKYDFYGIRHLDPLLGIRIYL